MGFDVPALWKPDTGGRVNSLKVVGTESREFRARKLWEEGKLFLAGRHRGRPRGGNRNFIQTLKCRPESFGRRRDAKQKNVRGDSTRCENRHGFLGASINQFDWAGRLIQGRSGMERWKALPDNASIRLAGLSFDSKTYFPARRICWRLLCKTVILLIYSGSLVQR